MRYLLHEIIKCQVNDSWKQHIVLNNSHENYYVLKRKRKELCQCNKHKVKTCIACSFSLNSNILLEQKRVELGKGYPRKFIEKRKWDMFLY